MFKHHHFEGPACCRVIAIFSGKANTKHQLIMVNILSFVLQGVSPPFQVVVLGFLPINQYGSSHQPCPGTSVVFPRAWLRCQHLKALPRWAQYDDATLGDFPDASSQTNLPQIPTASTKNMFFFHAKLSKHPSFFEFCYGRY